MSSLAQCGAFSSQYIYHCSWHDCAEWICFINQMNERSEAELWDIHFGVHNFIPRLKPLAESDILAPKLKQHWCRYMYLIHHHDLLFRPNKDVMLAFLKLIEISTGRDLRVCTRWAFQLSAISVWLEQLAFVWSTTVRASGTPPVPLFKPKLS